MVALEIDPAQTDTSGTAPLAAIGLMPLALHPDVRRAIAGLHVRLELSETADLVAARLESACPELLLIDTDMLGCPADLCRFARSLRPAVKVFGLAYYWSEREEALHACVDAILHKPARGSEWKPTLRRFGVSDDGPRSNLL